MKKLFWVSFIAVMLGGCAGRVGVDDLSPEQREAFRRMDLLESSELPAGAILLGSIEGVSCKVGGASRFVPTQEDALIQLRAKAALDGADAIVDAVCARKGLDLAHNCAESYVCTGTSVSLTQVNGSAQSAEIAEIESATKYQAPVIPGIGVLVRDLRNGDVKLLDAKDRLVKFDFMDDRKFEAVYVEGDVVQFKHPDFDNVVVIGNLAGYIEGNSLDGTYFGFEGTSSISTMGGMRQALLFKFIK